ncbi:MAG TPA: vitamin K epoxide reductase family protein [Acidimicrobiales bacterium]|nr:vitamin K epoxide reductase family protein [Acidimicrobiales bacterium]
MNLPAEDPLAAELYPPPWMVLSSMALCLVGLVIDSYLTFEHYTGNSSLVCSDKGLINCGKVTTSVYSKLLGIPVADLGVAFFLGMLVLCLPAAWRAANLRIHQLRLLGVVVSMLMVLYLLYGELRLRAICLYCTATHVVAFLLFIVVLAADTYVR